MRLLALVLPVVALAGAAAFVLRPAPEIAPIDPPKADNFAAELVERGEVLARIGACEVCHTAEGGEPYAGGLALHTPFGKLYSTNLTPDATTGIGRWSKDAFVRAMREGVGRDGSHLYPAFPYTHFAKAKDEDLGALYAFLMSLDAVQAPAKANELAFPFNQRALLAGWKMLFHDA
ncbi:MAG: c-type cytochrome, partial [Rubrivivax sp.]